MRAVPTADAYIGKYYVCIGRVYRPNARYEPIKLVQTPRGWRVILVNHAYWPKQTTKCFSLSLKRLKERIDCGEWVEDNPHTRVSEGL